VIQDAHLIKTLLLPTGTLTKGEKAATIDFIGSISPLTNTLERCSRDEDTSTLLTVALRLITPASHIVRAHSEVMRATGTRGSWSFGGIVSGRSSLHSVVKAVGFTVGSFVVDLTGLTVGSSVTSQLLQAALHTSFGVQ